MEEKCGREERLTKWQPGRRRKEDGRGEEEEEQKHTEVLLISEYF